MSNPSIPESQFNSDANESFDGLLSQYERSHQRKRESGNQVEGTVVAVSPESVFFDIGFKTEGILSLTDLQKTGKAVKPGDKLHVTVKARDPEGYYQLSLFKVIQPTDWASLEKAFLEKATISGTVTGLIKGGLSVDIGMRAFMPASRSGVRDAAEMEKLVEQEIWGLLLTHYGIRHLMREAADQADLDPDRMSFIRALRVIRRQVTGQAAFSPSETSENDR